MENNTGGARVGIGTTAPSARLDVNGPARVRNLAGSGSRIVTVDAAGSPSAQGQSGTATIGSGTNTRVVTIIFPTSFSATPKVICTVRTETGAAWNDTFAVTTKSPSTKQFTVKIHRVDATTSWVQNLLCCSTGLPCPKAGRRPAKNKKADLLPGSRLSRVMMISYQQLNRPFRQPETHSPMPIRATMNWQHFTH